MEWSGNQEPCHRDEDKGACAQTTKGAHLRLLQDQWQGTCRAHLEDLIDEGGIKLVDDQMYCSKLELSPDEKIDVDSAKKRV